MASFKQIKFYLLLLSGVAISVIGIYIFFTSSITGSFLNLGRLTYAPDFFSKIPSIGQNTKTITFRQDGNTYTLTASVADTQASREKGLMGVKSMPVDQGMLFVFDNGNDIRDFWMKDTLIPLDMIFVSDTGEVVYIQHDAPPCSADPCPIYSSQFPAKYVIETNAGWTVTHSIASGAKVSF